MSRTDGASWSHFLRALLTDTQGYRNRYDIIDHEHEKKTFMYFFHRPIFAKIREFATIVLLNGIERFSESTLNSS
jgi:hypothetical protein